MMERNVCLGSIDLKMPSFHYFKNMMWNMPLLIGLPGFERNTSCSFGILCNKQIINTKINTIVLNSRCAFNNLPLSVALLGLWYETARALLTLHFP